MFKANNVKKKINVSGAFSFKPKQKYNSVVCINLLTPPRVHAVIYESSITAVGPYIK